MKVAVLADIHGNSVALGAVLKDASQKGAEKLIILGDLVGYYYDSKEVLQQLKEWDKEVISGNHERMLRKSLEDEGFARKYRAKYGSALSIATKTLGKEELAYLTSLPDHKAVKIDGVKFELHHGAPGDEDAYLYPDSKAEYFQKALAGEFDFVLIGHSHYQFNYSFNQKYLINPGSVGQSRLEGGLACWAIIDTRDQTHELIQTKFDVKGLLDQVELTDPGVEYLGKVLLRKNEQER